MKWLIASDIHGSAYWCRRLIERYRQEEADRLLLLGDILYHGPRNDLPAEYDPKKTASMLNAMKNEIVCVRGNCDAEVDGMVLEFPISPGTVLIECGGGLIYASHGHHVSEDVPPPLRRGDILLCGHTHIPSLRQYDNFVYMNPGSVSIPKENSRNGYMTLECGRFVWLDMDGNVLNEWTIENLRN